MDSSFDVSFNATALLEEHQLDPSDMFLPEDEDFLHLSPIKKNTGSSHQKKTPTPNLAKVSVPDMPCQYLLPSNELFQVTHHLRQGQNLQNGKIRKLLELLQGENDSYELDDQLRTRVFRARASKNIYHKDTLDSFDMELDSFLRDTNTHTSSHTNSQINTNTNGRRLVSPLENRSKNNEHSNDNKENVSPILAPSKRKLSDSNKRPPLKKSKSYASIPLHQSLGNANNPPTKKSIVSRLCDARLSPQRVSVPKPVSTPGKPSLKLREDLRIFLVDSLTGSVADATQFGTELNSSNCEGFPLPDNCHEVVQIPTNDTTSSTEVQKMAIIKAFLSKRQLPKLGSDSHTFNGFYSKQEFEEQRAKKRPQVSIFQDKAKRVRWSEDLEW